VNGTYHDSAGKPLVNTSIFPDTAGMVAKGHAIKVKMGWYHNNCWCNERGHSGAQAHYTEDALATVQYGFDGIKVDSCGPAGNVSAWRLALDMASPNKRIQLENCRNYDYTREISPKSKCDAELFRSTEDNAPDFLSIMANLVTNGNKPGTGGDVHGGLPVSHSGCWSYPDMLETTGSGTCRQDLPDGTCGAKSGKRRVGGLNQNQSKAHFGAWCVVSSPLILGHNLADDSQYDQAWPIISNKAALKVNQAWNGVDPGRLITKANTSMQNLSLYHGAGCECVWGGQSLPEWTVWGKQLDIAGLEAATIAINFSDEVIPAKTITVSARQIFTDTSTFSTEEDIWGGGSPRKYQKPQAVWEVPELAPQSSYFVILRR